jgi:predicted dienelactone hydrolase
MLRPLVALGVGPAILVLSTSSLWAAAPRADSPYGPKPGPHAVETLAFEWKDARRDREVPAKLYLPKDATAPGPVIVFSHGLGGTREGYEYLGRHWASFGYVSVHLQHHGSDDAVWRGKPDPMQAMRQSLTDPLNAVNRPLDVRFALDQLESLNRDDPRLKGRLDLAKAGMAGHSFGAFTTLAVAGQAFVAAGGREFSAADPRVKAAIAMSSPGPRDQAKADQTFAAIKIPVFHMTGTLDDSPITNTKAAERRLPFDHSQHGDRYLVTFKDGDHMIFSGRGGLRGLRGAGAKDAQFQELICTSSTAFWHAYLRGDDKAKQWLAAGGFEKMLSADGVLEKKLQR